MIYNIYKFKMIKRSKLMLKFRSLIASTILTVISIIVFSVFSMPGTTVDAISTATKSSTTIEKPVIEPIKPKKPDPVYIPPTEPSLPQPTNDTPSKNIVEWSNTPSSWAKDILESSISTGISVDSIMGQYNKPITRIEFTQLIMKLYEKINGTVQLSPDNKPFLDTDSIDVAKAHELGIVKGVGNNRFDPNALLTRQEAAVILYNEWIKLYPDDTFSKESITFIDNYKIADWAKKAMNAIFDIGLIKGVDNNTIDPLGFTTREQAITMTVRSNQKLMEFKTPDAISSATISGSGTNEALDAVSSATIKSDDDNEDEDEDDDEYEDNDDLNKD